MSRPRSRSPVYSRIPTLHGRRADRFFDGQIHSSVQSDSWRNAEYDNKVESNTHWNRDPNQGEQHVDHWAKFIDAIEHAQKKETSPTSSYQVQGHDERPLHSPRRLPRERLPSPDHARFDMEEHYRMPSPVWNRNEGIEKNIGRQEHSSQKNHKESRDRSYPRHSEGRRPDRMEYEFHNEEHDDKYKRGSFSERSTKSDYIEHHPSKGFTDFGLQDEYSEHHRGFSLQCAPVIVEHDHGISKQVSRSRDHSRTSGRPRSRDPPRRSETSRNREPHRDRRDQGQHTRTLQGRHSGPSNTDIREDLRNRHASYEKESKVRDRARHPDRARMESHSRDPEKQREMEFNDMNDIDLRTDRSDRERDSVHEWGKERSSQENHGRLMMGKNEVSLRPQYQRNLNTNTGPVPRMDFSEQETLKIKVDMSRPIGQSSHLGYSSDRQLSLDLVNVGRQRLDFLPLLEHSGTYRESAVHSGTFAQEIITLVHQVKENCFKGQGITLNDRFSNEQYYSLQGDFKEEEEEEEEEMGCVGPVLNRPLGMPSSETQIFCKIGPERLHSRQLVPDPGDLRYDLERRRQQRLEDVKITIAGGNFTQTAPQSHESEPLYMSEDPEELEGNFGWSEQAPERPRQWNGPRQRMDAPNRQNFNPRGNSNRNSRPQGRRT
ncbi:BCLAF1 and THRAP3 family member 3 isoform X2 [Xyrauchen texanus]|uniref:BCLAF1 and THRAP3 family member 3 isoform X2 n=1 Tax=Xyrauchen texanus TaxID=154827 RepID=UPI0022421A99|nr:BCLAF1 and THRAP3 family member 3 isoform X2 [Xyrauchen texanus]